MTIHDVRIMMMIRHEHNGGECPSISFSSEWDVLGPFQIGTRGNISHVPSGLIPNA